MSETKPIDDGGPAFPVNGPNGNHPGMSIRDYFAGQALIGMLANYRTGVDADGPDDTFHHSFNRDLAIDKDHITGELAGAKEIAGDAYLFADALLAARKVADNG